MPEQRPPSIFIGSSTERIDYANALENVLDHDMLTTVWTYGVFLPGEGTLSSLIRRAKKTDFAAFFLTPDDAALVRGEYLKTPRDNLLFELGLFISELGPRRTFFLVPREDVKLPTDLDGITPISYRADRDEDEIFNAVNPAATMIRTVVKRAGPRPDAGGAGGMNGADISPEAIVAIGGLGVIARAIGGTLEVHRLADGRHEIAVIDHTRLGTSVEVDLSEPRSAEAIERLGERLRP